MTLDPKYETGVVWQDFQHQQLISLFEKVKEAKKNETDKKLYRYTMAFLAMYVNHHFKLEEKYMLESKYPDMKIHSREHHEFIQKLKQFRNENKEYSLEAADELLMFMGEWILTHILEDDKKLGKHILSWRK